MIKLIENDTAYRISELMDMDLANNADASDEFDIIALLVAHYEKLHYPVPPPQPLDAIKFRMEQSGINDAEFNEIIGVKNGKKDILSGKQKLTLPMIRKLHDKLHIPAEILIMRY
jgi:HTH-type transcriptional regulator/antitoxin HigA